MIEQQHSMRAYTSEFDRCPKEAANVNLVCIPRPSTQSFDGMFRDALGGGGRVMRVKSYESRDMMVGALKVPDHRILLLRKLIVLDAYCGLQFRLPPQ